MEANKICLSSTAYRNNLVDSVKNIFVAQRFTDVTLVSDENQQVQAHKFIIIACSPVLEAMLSSNPHPHTLLYMRGIKMQELKAIVEFLYLGVTFVEHNRLVEFLKIAKELGIKELTSGVEESFKTQDKEKESHVSEIDKNSKEVYVNDEKKDCSGVISEILNDKLHDEKQFFCEKCEYEAPNLDVVPIASLEAFRALKSSNLEAFRALKPYGQIGGY